MAVAAELQQQVYDLLSKTSNLSFVSAESVAVGGLSLAPGQRVTAEVVAQLAQNRVQVKIGAQQLTMELPLSVRPGQNLELTYISEDPRHTFALSRPGVAAPPVSLSDASRLLSLLVNNEQVLDPRLRSSLASIGDMLRRSGGDSSVLAGFLDELLTYGTAGRPVVPATNATPGDSARTMTGDQAGAQGAAAGNMKLSQFEDSASKLLLNVAQRSRFTLAESVTQPLNPLPLALGDEVNASVQGSLPGGRVFVQLAGESLELRLSRPVQAGEILRLILVAQQPRLVFALMGQAPSLQPANVSDAARWLSAMESNQNGQAGMQQAVMERLQQVVTSLPPGSPALAAILGEAAVYGAAPWLGSRSMRGANPQQSGRLDDEVAKLLQALMQGSRMALVEPRLEAGLKLQYEPGQQLRGEVLQSLGSGRFMIQIAGQSMEVLLPKGIKAGDSLNLFFVGNDPPTMLLVRYGKAGDSQVSDTGRWVSTLLGMQNSSAPLDAGLGILRTLLKGAPTDPVLLEQQLAKGLRESGLFYESHLARWFAGEFRIEDLLSEPQGRLSGQASLAARFEQTAGQPQGLPLKDITPEMLEAAIKSKGGVHSYESGADSRTLPIVREQLAALQTGQLLFKGELFPGQPLEWRIEERENGRQENAEGGESWVSSIDLVMPRLGEVSATLRLESGKVSIKIEAGTESAAAELVDGREVLVEQLAAAGLFHGAIEVSHGKTA